MKILQVITSLRTGGAEKLIVDLAPRLQDDGFQVDVALFDDADTPFRRQLVAAGVHIVGLGHSPYAPACLWRLARIMGRYDIVHTHNTSPQLFAALASLVHRHVRLVTTEHNTSNRRRAWGWYRRVDRWMYDRYDTVICISAKARENLESYLGHTRARVVMVNNGVDVTAFAHAPANSALREGSRRFVAAMVAGFREQKDQDTLIRAMALLPKSEFEVWLVGDGVRRGALESLVVQLGLQDNVRFLGVRSDVASILHTADAVVMSSHYEGLSLSSIEGMAVGKPFVASDVDGLHDITQGAGLLFPEGDAGRLAAILRRLHDQPAEASEVARRCRERAQHFDISRMITAYENIYKSI